MSRPIFSPAAAKDIGDIWDFSAVNWGPDQADRYTDSIRDACHGLAEGERRGRKVDVRDGYFKLSVGRYIIFYRHTTETVEIIRVLHQARDVEAHL